MHHCRNFAPLDSWFLVPTEDFYKRKINIGFCPVCNTPVAEIWELAKNGECKSQRFSGVEANNFCEKLKHEVEYKSSQVVFARTRAKTYGWLYGVNKMSRDKKSIEQFSKDFYGVKELVKKVKKSF